MRRHIRVYTCGCVCVGWVSGGFHFAGHLFFQCAWTERWRRIGMKIDWPDHCACAAASPAPHISRHQSLLPYVCVTVSSQWSIPHPPAVMSFAWDGTISAASPTIIFSQKQITTHTSQLPIELPVLTQALDRWRPCQQAKNSFHQPAASRKSW